MPGLTLTYDDMFLLKLGHEIISLAIFHFMVVVSYWQKGVSDLFGIPSNMFSHYVPHVSHFSVMFSILLVLVILGTLYDVLVVHKLHLDAEEPFSGKPGGGLLRDDPPENDESSNIKYRVSRPNEHSPLLGGTSETSIQAPHEQGIGNVLASCFAWLLYTLLQLCCSSISCCIYTSL